MGGYCLWQNEKVFYSHSWWQEGNSSVKVFLKLRVSYLFKNSSLYLFWWSMIFNVILHLFGGTIKTFPCKTPGLIDKCCVWCDCSINQPFPHLTSSPQAPLINWDTRILKLGQFITLEWSGSVPVKGRVSCCPF